MSVAGFVGTYTRGDSEGIHHVVVSVDGTPSLELTGVTTVTDNPSFLGSHPDGSVLYAVHEVPDGGASAFQIREGSTSDPTLEPLGRVETGAGGPCHCSVHPSGEFLFVAHYTGAAVSVLPVGNDGCLGEPSDIVRHEGASRHPERQEQAHPHSVTPGPNGRYVYVPDLGMDTVVVYEFDEGSGSLERIEQVDTDPGAGPRHLEFHPGGSFVYLINELDSTLSAYRWDPKTGALTVVDSQSTLPESFDGDNLAADVHVHPTGAWVYGSNRGHDSVAHFAVRADGTLDPCGVVSSGGECPRNFAIDPTGTALLVENADTDEIVEFRVDGRSGEPIPTGAGLSVPYPVCLELIPAG